MNDSTVPVQSLKTLIMSTLSALLLAIVILVTVVGPAEYGLDPTGLGKAMGLTVFADSQQQHQAPALKSTHPVVSCPVAEQRADWLDIVVITVPALSGLEYKFHLKQNAELTYAWSTNGASLYFDFHGEPAGDSSGYFKSFKESTDIQSSGVLNAPFTGVHGWYWKNKTKKPVQVTLKTKGQYRIKGLI
jgi:hypothetical protein